MVTAVSGIRSEEVASDLALRGPAPVKIWAGVGVFWLALQAHAYLGWVFSGQATPTPPGPDPVPAWIRAFAIAFQVGTGVGALLILRWVVRQCRREGELVFDAILVIAFVSIFWADPIINFIRPLFFYNSILVNAGVWVMHIPGWSSPNGNHLPEPLVFLGSFYLAFGVGATILICWVMRRAKQRWNGLGVVGLVGVAFAAMIVADLLAEIAAVRTQMWAYPGAIHALSLWPGTRYQLPVYEFVFTGLFMTWMAALRFFRDDKGRSLVERGIDQVRASTRVRTLVRVLAVVGFANTVNLASYGLPMNIIGLHVDRMPDDYASWMVNRLCGEGTPYACPDPRLPVPLRSN